MEIQRETNSGHEDQLLNKVKDIFKDGINIRGYREMEVFVKKANQQFHKIHEENKYIFKKIFNVGVLKNIIIEALKQVTEGFDYLPVQISFLLQINILKNSNPMINLAILKALDAFYFIQKSRIKEARDESLQNKQQEDMDVFRRRLKQIGLQNWEKLPITDLKYFSSAFNMKSLSDEDSQPILAKINQLLQSQNQKQASDLIVYFNLQRHFDCKELIEILVQRGSVEQAVSLVHDNIECAVFLIKSLNLFKDSKIASELIKKLDLDHNLFPVLIDHQNFGALKSFVTRHCWQKAEEVALNYRNGIPILCEVLVSLQKYDEAISLAQRHTVQMKEKDILKINQNCQFPKLVENKLLSDDYFGPTEIFMAGGDPSEYLLLEYYGITEEMVLFISNEEDPNFQISVDHFLSSCVVGCDSEFRGRATNFDIGGVATLQMASEEMTVIYDCISLEKNEKFIDFLLEFFENESIEKVGHTFSSDITALNKTFDTQFTFNSIINIENAFKNGNQTIGLSKIVYQEYKKKMSKFNQESNWNQRPLRKGQLHYGALDAVSVLQLLLKLRSEGAERTKNLFSEQINSSQPKNEDSDTFKDRKGRCLVQNCDKLQQYIINKNFKFMVDEMIKKLAYKLRNLGFDASYVEGIGYKEKVTIAEEEERIILTRDNNLMKVKKDCPVIRICSPKPDSIFLKLIEQFKSRKSQKCYLSLLIPRCSQLDAINAIIIN